MILHQLTVNNFRCFYGEHKIRFAAGKNKNVTIVTGGNGTGKTTFLNAFIWVLYGTLTADVEDKKKIVNERAAKEEGSRAKAIVELDFEHEDVNYVIKRSIQNTLTAKASPPSIHLRDINGNLKPESEEQILRILPKEMYPYFFFNGENIEEHLQEGHKGKLAKAIRTVMGLQLIEKTRDELQKKVLRDFQNQIKKYSNTKEMTDLVEKIEEITEEIKNLDVSIETKEKDLEKSGKDKKKLDLLLSKHNEVKELQKDRLRSEKKIEGIKKAIVSREIQHKKNISDYGFYFFLKPIIDRTKSRLKEYKDMGLMPPKYMDSFVTDLLDAGKCICGRELNHGTVPFNNVLSRRTPTIKNEVVEKTMACQVTVNRYPKEYESYANSYNDIQTKIADLKKEQSNLEIEMSNITRKIMEKGGEQPEILEQEKRRNNVLELIGALKTTIKHETEKRTQLEKEKAEHEKALTKGSSKNSKAMRFSDLHKYTVEVIDYLDDLLKYRISKVHKELEQKVDDQVRKMYTKSVRAVLSDDFNLIIEEQTDSSGTFQKKSKSTGENQIAYLAFIGGLVYLARQLGEEKGSDYYLGGGEYPIIMDSPYGQLDGDYRKEVSEWIPTVSSQVIVFLSSSQYNEVVEKALDPHKGQQYLIRLHTNKSTVENPTTMLNGKEVQQIITGSSHTFSELVQIEERV
jgi:DNA sulfur modification protein DndD